MLWKTFNKKKKKEFLEKFLWNLLFFSFFFGLFFNWRRKLVAKTSQWRDWDVFLNVDVLLGSRLWISDPIWILKVSWKGVSLKIWFQLLPWNGWLWKMYGSGRRNAGNVGNVRSVLDFGAKSSLIVCVGFLRGNLALNDCFDWWGWE